MIKVLCNGALCRLFDNLMQNLYNEMSEVKTFSNCSKSPRTRMDSNHSATGLSMSSTALVRHSQLKDLDHGILIKLKKSLGFVNLYNNTISHIIPVTSTDKYQEHQMNMEPGLVTEVVHLDRLFHY